MNKKALEQLFKIVKMEGISRADGTEARERALYQWLAEHTVDVSCEQVIVKAKLSSDEQDFIKYHMATKLAEQLMEGCVDIQVGKNKVTAKIKAIKRK